MKTVTMPKSEVATMHISANQITTHDGKVIKVSRGHQPHRSGAGKQHSRNTNRMRTRQQLNGAALKGW